MKKQILLMIATILFLTSCAETPDEVKEDMIQRIFAQFCVGK